MDSIAALLNRHPDLAGIRPEVEGALELLAGTYAADGKVLVCGNGGSAADAEHIVGELMKSMIVPRPVTGSDRHRIEAAAPARLASEAGYLAGHLEGALPAVSLSSQTALITAIGNDTAGDMIFAQQVYGYGRSGDLLWAISTSGSSRNVVLAGLAARARGMKVLAMTGDPGEPLGEIADLSIRVPPGNVSEVQQLHQAIYHWLCAALESRFFDAEPHY